ncbi:PucR family transcriptional regulator [Actinokineospora enzanensis]|uniref:PucR family transcriptional regulator n=1 Tax=Actinokineospora enzanensis TaxID=155975 RepID=UPI00316AE706
MRPHDAARALLAENGAGRRATGLTALVLVLLRQAAARTTEDARGELLADLLTGARSDPVALLTRGHRLGIDLAVPRAVLVALSEHLPRRRLAAAAAPHADLAGVHADHVVLLVRASHPGESAARLAAILTSTVDTPVTVGAAGPVSGVDALARTHAEAERCARALSALGRAGQGGGRSDLGFVGLLLGEHTPEDLESYVHATLGPVLEYDERRGTELLRTLEAYFSAGANLTRAKDLLHVHVNTVVQRLERIGSLLGSGWQEQERALEIQLALRLFGLTSA